MKTYEPTGADGSTCRCGREDWEHVLACPEQPPLLLPVEVMSPATFERERATVRPLYSYHRAAYGFIATSPEQVQRDGTWQGYPQRPFRPLLVLAWSVGRAWIESLKLGTVEQLRGGVPAQLFEVPISPETFLTVYLERPVYPLPPSVQLIGERVKVFPIDERAPRWLDFPAVSVGSPMAARFKGELRGFLLLGHELDDGDPRDATGSAPAADL